MFERLDTVRRLLRYTLAASLATGLAAQPAAHAERADRDKPMVIDSNGTQPGTVDLNKRSAVFTGNVVITQGTLQIHADRVEVSEDPNGQRLGHALGSPERLATFRQKGDREDEWTEGEALRIDYDSAANRVRFVGNAHLRLLRGQVVSDEGRAAVITYDTVLQTIAFDGGGAPTPASLGGRTRVIFTPRPSASAAGSRPPAVEGGASAAGASR